MTNTRKILLACIPVEIAVAVAFVAASTSGSPPNSTLGSAHAAFDHGEFELAFQLASRAIWTLPPNDTSESLFHIMDIARRRRWYTEHDVRLPTNAAWALESKSMSREKRIQYLCQRIPLSKGPLIVPGTIVPSSICLFTDVQNRSVDMEDKLISDEGLIDPFRELHALALEEDDLPQLYQHFAVNWIFQPDTPDTRSPSSCYPSSRYCLCAVVNSVTGIVGLIRESDMCDKDWQDPSKIANLIRGAKDRIGKQ